MKILLLVAALQLAQADASSPTPESVYASCQAMTALLDHADKSEEVEARRLKKVEDALAGLRREPVPEDPKAREWRNVALSAAEGMSVYLHARAQADRMAEAGLRAIAVDVCGS